MNQLRHYIFTVVAFVIQIIPPNYAHFNTNFTPYQLTVLGNTNLYCAECSQFCKEVPSHVQEITVHAHVLFAPFVNVDPEYECGCLLYYKLSDDQRTCTPVEHSIEMSIFLLYSYDSFIDNVPLPGNNVELPYQLHQNVHSEPTEIISLMNGVQKYIIWVDKRLQKVFKAEMSKVNDTKEVIFTFPKSMNGAEENKYVRNGLAVDWIHNHVYLVDQLRHSIWLVHAVSKKYTSLIKSSDEDEKFQSIAVDPIEAHLFVLCNRYGANSDVIARYDLDGEGRVEIFNFEPNQYQGMSLYDMTIDWTSQRVYAVVKRDVYWDLISLDYSGAQERQFKVLDSMMDDHPAPSSMVIFAGRVYLLLENSTSVFSVSSFLTENNHMERVELSERSKINPHFINDIAISSGFYQMPPNIDELCKEAHCSDFCVPKLGNEAEPAICLCADGKALGDDGSTCVNKDERDYKEDSMFKLFDGACDIYGEDLLSTVCNKENPPSCSAFNFCNKTVECPNGRDEEDELCQRTEKYLCQKDNGGCSDICVEMPVSRYCKCHEGRFMTNETHCRSLTECEHCNQDCAESENGKSTCTCATGYFLNDYEECEANDRDGFIIFLEGNSINTLSIDSYKSYPAKIEETILTVDDKKQISGFDFLYDRGELFWEGDTGYLMKTTLKDGTNHQVKIFPIQIDAAFTIDWIYNQIYWLDYIKNNVILSDIDGKWKVTVIENNLQDYNWDIVVDPLAGFIFRTMHRYQTTFRYWKIGKSNLDGSNPKVIIDEKIGLVWGIALDLVMKRVYWIDHTYVQISHCNYEGSDRELLLHSHKSYDGYFHKFHNSIAFFEGVVYTSAYRHMHRISKMGGHIFDNVIYSSHNEELKFDLKIYHRLSQPPGDNHCINTNCTHICIAVLDIHEDSVFIPKCYCPDGMILQEDNITCTGNQTNQHGWNWTTTSELPTTSQTRDPEIHTEKYLSNREVFNIFSNNVINLSLALFFIMIICLYIYFTITKIP